VAQGLHRCYNNGLKKPQATKCSDHRTTSLIVHTAKIVANILSRFERKIQDVLGDQFGFKRGKETRNATGMLRISEQTLKTDAELCFIDWLKLFGRVS
jgi:hypothetical protein